MFQTFPGLLFDRNIIGGHGVMCSVLTLTVSNNQGTRGVEFDKIYGIYFSPEFRAFRWPVLQRHGHDERERLRHR